MRAASSFIWFVVAVALTIGAAYLAGQYTPSTSPGTWYQDLIKPTWQPESKWFGIIWPILYVLIAIAGWLVLRDNTFSPADMFWFAGLIVNPYWSYVFFQLQNEALALPVMWFLWFLIGGFFFTAWHQSKIASWLIVPYWAWVSFALCLNMEIVRLNAI